MEYAVWDSQRRERFTRALHLRYQSTVFTISGKQVCVASWCTGTGTSRIDDVVIADWECADWRDHVKIGA